MAAGRRALALAAVMSLVLASGSSALAEGVMDNACPPDRVPSSPFFDTFGNVHEAAIDCVAWYGVASGTSQDTYAPGQEVRRDQMASFMARTFTAMRTELPPAGGRFSDVGGNQHQEAIERLAQAGVVSGTGGGQYSPGLVVQRGQMAAFLVRTYEYLTGTSLAASRDYFSDDNGSTHEDNINKAAEAQFTGGLADGRYAPAAAVRRDQMASFIARMLGAAVDRAAGGRLNAYPMGTSSPLVDGWRMSVVSSLPDGDAEIAAENQFNDAPASGRQFFIVRVRATFTGEGSSGFDGGFRLLAVGDGGNVYSTFEDSCGVVPDALSSAETFSGGTIEGNICFEVRSTDAPSLRVFDSEQERPSRPYFRAVP